MKLWFENSTVAVTVTSVTSLGRVRAPVGEIIAVLPLSQVTMPPFTVFLTKARSVTTWSVSFKSIDSKSLAGS